MLSYSCEGQTLTSLASPTSLLQRHTLHFSHGYFGTVQELLCLADICKHNRPIWISDASCCPSLFHQIETGHSCADLTLLYLKTQVIAGI